MLRFAANLTTLFTELPFEARFAAAANAGFKAVEFLFPYDYEPTLLQQKLHDNQLSQVLFNAYPGDWVGGERGLAALPGREADFEKSIEQALNYAAAMNTPTLHVMSGVLPANSHRQACEAVWESNIKKAADAFASAGKTLVLEPLNPFDMPGYFIASQYDAAKRIEQLGRDNVKLQFDFYHAQIVDGNITTMLRELMPVIGHIQIASNPDRHEPDSGELNLSHVLGTLNDLGYDGWIGCEYHPKHDTQSGLAWVKPWL